MKKLLLLLAVLCGTVSGWAQNVEKYYTPGERTTTLEVGKTYFISAATWYGNQARRNLLYNNNGTLAYSSLQPDLKTRLNKYLFTVEKAEDNTYFIKNSQGRYLQSNALASTETETGITIVPYHTVKGTVTCGDDVQACDKDGNKIEYNDINENTPIVCVYYDNNTGWRHINGLETGKATAFAFYNAVETEAPVYVETTTDPSNPIYYTIKNVRGNAYATYDGKGQYMKLRSQMEKGTQLFYFTKGSTEGTYKVHNYATDLLCAGVNSWTTDGIDWYIQESDCNSHIGLAISKTLEMTTNGSEAWNDYQNKHTSVNSYGGNDAGSVWQIEKFEGNPGIEVSTNNSINNIILHYIRSNRRETYVNFDGHNSTFKEGAKGLNSYWYFVQDTEKQKEAPEGFIACRIYNAAYATGVENHSSGYMGDANWPERVYYIGIKENDNCGYIIRRADTESNGWHDFGGNNVGDYGLGDNGSLWRIYPSEKTATELQSESKSKKTDALTILTDAAEADYYTWSVSDIATAKAAIEGLDTEKMHNVISIAKEEAMNELRAKEKGTSAPSVGQYIQFRNRERGGYLTIDAQSNVIGTQNANDKGTLWLVEDGGKIKNVSTGKYMGAITQSTQVKVDDSALTFDMENQTDCYAVFKETTKTSGNVFGHMAGHHILVGWGKDSYASHWIISQITVDACVEKLQKIYDKADNTYGDAIGLYKTTEESNTQKNILYEIITNIESGTSDADVETLYGLIASFDDYFSNPTRQFNTPEIGKFYRLKNQRSGKYMSGNGSTIKLNGDGNANEVLSTIFYLDENNVWLSYADGRYMDTNERGYSDIGTAKAGEFGLASGGAQENVITYKNSNHWTYGGADTNGDGTPNSLDRGSSAANDGYNWTIEEVTWLPVPMNTTAGYATLYSPVALSTYEDGSTTEHRVEAYVGTINNNYFSMERIDAEDGIIPANTPVVLKYVNGYDEAKKAVYLEIKESDKTYDLENDLEGTVADTYISRPSYVLSMQEGVVGFYKAMMNQQDGASFLNNGFRAYLPAGDNNARSLVFDFGGTETGIDELKGENGNVKAEVYDLAGRRVLNARKGVFVVNGKVIVK